jgi:hypothetical protein
MMMIINGIDFDYKLKQVRIEAHNQIDRMRINLKIKELNKAYTDYLNAITKHADNVFNEFMNNIQGKMYKP